MSISTTSHASPQANVVNKLLDSYTTHNMKAVADCLSEDFKQILLPSSLGQPPKTKEEWVTFMTPFAKWVPDLKVRVYYNNFSLAKKTNVTSYDSFRWAR
jgi:hypothetical protein